MDPFIAILIGVFWAAIIVGLVVRFIRAKKGQRLKAVAEPLVAAADSYQENLIGKTGTAQLKDLDQN
ncbi:hypothetical protein M2118_001590 [Aurantimicrobium minutum]|uniref:hypothetical protein n=1 Tax=Aurantimicrobium minutum TaxID=708131 RepID=UPI002476929F|nr:hypothetical protein [Aurantimicrobium minutum]MDH6278599.1 hypothetical protein [Aurantimicrobium minutum]